MIRTMRPAITFIVCTMLCARIVHEMPPSLTRLDFAMGGLLHGMVSIDFLIWLKAKHPNRFK